MTELGAPAFVLLTLCYLAFVYATMRAAMHSGDVPAWKRWIVASAVLNTVGTWTSGDLHRLVVWVWIVCVLAAIHAGGKAWLAAESMRIARKVHALQDKLEAIEQRVEMLHVLRYCPVAEALPPYCDDCRRVADASLVTGWPTLYIDEREGCEVAE